MIQTSFNSKPSNLLHAEIGKLWHRNQTKTTIDGSIMQTTTNTLLIEPNHKNTRSFRIYFQPNRYSFYLSFFFDNTCWGQVNKTKTIPTVWDSGSRPPRKRNQDENDVYLIYPNEPNLWFSCDVIYLPYLNNNRNILPIIDTYWLQKSNNITQNQIQGVVPK